jgi:hypothetical protein
MLVLIVGARWTAQLHHGGRILKVMGRWAMRMCVKNVQKIAHSIARTDLRRTVKLR